MLILLCLFAFLAGFIDAMVGGGGLIQLPAFFILQPHLGLMQTLAANKTSSFLGTSVSVVRYVKRVRVDWKHISVGIMAALAGSFGGALLVSHIRKEQFMPFIIVTLTLVLFYTFFKKELGLHRQEKSFSSRKYYVLIVLTGLVIGFYDGLIGPGAGSFFIFAFVVIFGFDFLNASANAKILNTATSIAALAFFLFKGAIVWSIALPVAAANMAGNYIGSHFALKKGSGFIRVFFLIVVTALILKLGYDYL